MEKPLAKNAFFNVIYQLVNTLFPLISAMYISRVLLPEGVGLVAFTQNIASYFLTLVPLGIGSYGVRVIAQNYGNKTKRNTRFWELFLINAVSTVFFSALYYLLIFTNNSFAEHRYLYLICGIPIVLNVMEMDWFYQGMEEYKYITMRNLLVKLLSLAALFLFVRDPGDLIPYLAITVAATFGNRLFNVVYARKFVGFDTLELRLRPHLAPQLILMANILLANLYSKVDITMLGVMGDSVSVGLYSNAFKLVHMILAMCCAITAAFLPRLSYYYMHDREKYEELVNRGVQIVLFFTVPAVVGLNLIAPRLIPLLFGEAFSPAVSTLRWLSLLILIKGLGDLLCFQVLISSGQEKKQTPVYAFAAVLNIALNALLIPRMAQDGAAIASVAAELLLNLLLLHVSRKTVRIRMDGKNTAKTLLAALLMAAAVQAVLYFCCHAGNFAAVAGAVLAGLLVYGGASILTQNTISKMAWSRFQEKRKMI